MIPEYDITLIAGENIPRVFPHIVPRLERALAEGSGEWTVESVAAMLMAGTAQLWIGATKSPELKMIGITRILPYPNVKRLSFDLLEGEDLAGFMHHLEYLENWAAQFGVTEVEARVRPGLRKKLEAIGFRKQYEVILRPIKSGRH